MQVLTAISPYILWIVKIILVVIAFANFVNKALDNKEIASILWFFALVATVAFLAWIPS